MKVILVRHGETIANCEERYAGWTDTMLTDKGKKQALSAKSKIDNEEIDLIVTSDLSRAIDTEHIMTADRKIDRIALKGFREMNFGDWENMTPVEIKTFYEEEVLMWWNDGVNFKTPNGESLLMMYQRVINEYKIMLNKYGDKNILLVTHSGVMRAILSEEICGNIDGYWKFRIENCAVVVIEYVDGFPVLQIR